MRWNHGWLRISVLVSRHCSTGPQRSENPKEKLSLLKTGRSLCDQEPFNTQESTQYLVQASGLIETDYLSNSDANQIYWGMWSLGSTRDITQRHHACRTNAWFGLAKTIVNRTVSDTNNVTPCATQDPIFTKTKITKSCNHRSRETSGTNSDSEFGIN